MTNSKQTKEEEKKSGFSPVIAAVAGAVVGVGVAIAGAVALADKENKQKVDDAIANTKDKAKGIIKDVQAQVEDKQNQVEKKVSQEKEMVRAAAIDVVDSLQNLTADAKDKIKKA